LVPEEHAREGGAPVTAQVVPVAAQVVIPPHSTPAPRRGSAVVALALALSSGSDSHTPVARSLTVSNAAALPNALPNPIAHLQAAVATTLTTTTIKGRATDARLSDGAPTPPPPLYAPPFSRWDALSSPTEADFSAAAAESDALFQEDNTASPSSPSGPKNLEDVDPLTFWML
jgi:hypothetical protein